MDEEAVVEKVPGVSNTVVGELASRTPTEVGMEGFFSICGHVSDARKLMQEIPLSYWKASLAEDLPVQRKNQEPFHGTFQE